MPVILSTLILLIAALGGYLLAVVFVKILFRPYSPKKIIGFKLHGILPSALPAMANQAASRLQNDFLSAEQISAKLDNPILVQKLKPEIEKHIDEFLKTKLKESFPLLANFMGEKTLAKFKSAFLTEVETLLPSVLKSYSANLIQEWNPAGILAEKINNMGMEKLETVIRQHTCKQILAFKIMGALLGAAIGLVQLLLIQLF